MLELLKDVIFPVLAVQNKEFTIHRKEEYGGIITYSSIETVIEDFRSEKLYPGDLKLGLIEGS